MVALSVLAGIGIVGLGLVASTWAYMAGLEQGKKEVLEEFKRCQGDSGYTEWS